eukprot:23685_1
MEADDQREGQPQPMNETRTTMPTQTSVVQVVSPIQHRQAATPTQHVQTKPQRPTTQPRRNTLTLPKGWRRARTADGKVYYQNDITKTTQWTLPTSSASQSNLVKSEKNPPPKYAYKEDNAQIVRRMTSFKSELDQLLHVIDSHMEFMKTHEKNVDKIIAASGEQYANLLRTAKDTALAREKEILNEIMNISTMDQFLNDIILVENLFNSVYTADNAIDNGVHERSMHPTWLSMNRNQNHIPKQNPLLIWCFMLKAQSVPLKNGYKPSPKSVSSKRYESYPIQVPRRRTLNAGSTNPFMC